ncbi:hypothetical protein ACFQYP_00675 [Nonomuraea antimicrobica]
MIDGKVPFDQHGSLIRDPGLVPDDIEIQWTGPKSFEARLRLVRTKTAIGYGKYVTWAEVHGIRRFPMAIEDLMPVVRGTLIDHGVVEAVWIPKKRRGRRGDEYGIALLPKKRFLEQEEHPEETPDDDDS